MANKQNLLIQTLLEKNRCLTAAQLANQLGISVRTVHNYINAVNEQSPGMIVSTAKGYEIVPHLARQALKQDTNDIPQTAAERCNYILNRLVQSGGSLDLYELCDEIFVSTTTFHSLLGRMRRLTRDYDLTLSVSSNRITLKGTERNRRRLLSSLLYSESSSAFTSIDALQSAFPSIDIEEIRCDVMKVFNEYHYFINDYSCINLLLHIAIAINRLQNGYATSDAEIDDSVLREEDRQVASQIIARLEWSFNVKFTSAEAYELALLLVSRATALDYQSISLENISSYIGSSCLDLVRLLIDTVKEAYDIHLDEPEFFIRFALHIRNLFVRASHSSFCKNPLVSEIRQTCPLIYDVSAQLSGIILEHTGIAINDDEIAYIALHIGGALETQKELASRVPVALFCPSYYNMDSSLADRITKKLDGKIVLTNVFTREEDLKKIPAQMLVISTVRLHHLIDLPVVVISPFLTNSDCLSISRKVDEIHMMRKRSQFRENLNVIMGPDLFECGSAHRTREAVIHHICERLHALGYTESDFENDVLEREGISSTAFSQFAIPHTLKMRSKRTGMFVYISRNPIQWGESDVNLVLMLCFNPNERKIFYDIFEPLSMILLDAGNLKEALACQNYESLINFFVDHMEL